MSDEYQKALVVRSEEERRRLDRMLATATALTEAITAVQDQGAGTYNLLVTVEEDGDAAFTMGKIN